MTPITETFHLYGGNETLEYQENPYHKYFHDKDQVCSSTGVGGLLDKSAPLMSWAVKCALTSMEASFPPGTMVDEVNMVQALSDARVAHKKTVSKAADVGTMVHDWYEMWVQAQIQPNVYTAFDLPVNRLVRSGVEQTLGWFDENVDEFIFAERKVLSIKHKFAGTADTGFISKKDRASVSDYKTGKSVLSSWGKESGKVYTNIRLQVASYVGALHEEGVIKDPKNTDRWVFHIPAATGQFHAYNLADQDQVWYSNWEEDYDCFLHLREVHRHVKGY